MTGKCGTTKKLVKELYALATADCAMSTRFFETKPFNPVPEGETSLAPPAHPLSKSEQGESPVSFDNSLEDEKEYPTLLSFGSTAEPITASKESNGDSSTEASGVKKSEDEDQKPDRKMPKRRQHSLRLDGFSGDKL